MSPERAKDIILIALDSLDGILTSNDVIHSTTNTEKIIVGELLTCVAILAANVVKDIRENLRNLVGGRMSHYENLVQRAVDVALDDLKKKAAQLGYDGVIGVKISHPMIVDGGVEIIVYGNGFKVGSSDNG